MILLIFTLVLLMAIIALGQLNPGAITINFFGLVIKNLPMSIFMLIFMLIGIGLASSAFGSKYYRLKREYNALVTNNEDKVDKDGTGNGKGNSREDSLQESGE